MKKKIKIAFALLLALSLSACAGKAQNTKNQVTTNTTEETQTSQKEDIEETKEDSNAKEVVKEQVVKGLEGLSAEYVSKMIIAYEPVWSIGTGRNASKEIAQDVCHFIRKEIANLYGRKVANKVIIQYGGSVKPENSYDYLTCPDIDGVLVGGASLKPESFEALVSAIMKG